MANEIISTSIVSPFHSRSRKLDEQRILIDEKNKQKRKLSGKISSLPIPQVASSQPNTNSNTPDFSIKTSQYYNDSPKSTPNTVNLFNRISSFSNSTPVEGAISTLKDLDRSKLDSTIYSGFRHDIFESNNRQVLETCENFTTTTDPDNPNTSYKEPIGSSECLLFNSSLIGNDLETDISSHNFNFQRPPTLTPISTSSKPFNVKSKIMDLTDFVTSPANDTQFQYCQIQRNKSGIDNNIFPIYELFLENPTTDQNLFILASRRRRKSKFCNYLLTTTQNDLSRGSSGYVGKLRANFLGTGFLLYSYGVAPENDHLINDGNAIKEVLCSIQYQQNVMGLRGPRKMTVFLPAVYDGTRLQISESTNENDLSDHCLLDPKLTLTLENKIPDWNSNSQTYNLNFNGRVTQASVKNFQLVNTQDGRIVMQFGRIGKDLFTLDYSYPLSPLQAFGIALSSFERKIACE